MEIIQLELDIDAGTAPTELWEEKFPVLTK